ncbi:hypothetical protein J2T02_002579 [Chitinophaga terrae (ex Kim and Jung 2007)]|uniref:hypothetical protein n=1 Tax=Chitinophaga terrae (ex Kim and Jung 2007) TaxID=408074 RepID=UPI00277F4C93|nr:hypothetical protein [Chitinophaga terrae (ex Kim and Jung 2007)]MDQ0107460.1 hypothetical protein [Chitinophaga terrae (ex Kim and Jung 2007)]
MLKSLFSRRRKDDVLPGTGGNSHGTPNKYVLRFCNYLQHAEGCFTNGQKKVLFGIFFLLFGGCCLMQVLKPAAGRRSIPIVPDVTTVTPATNAYDSNPMDLRQASWVLGFQHYLDSMRSDPGGKRFYDSLAAVRPGLIDSVRELGDFIRKHNVP